MAIRLEQRKTDRILFCSSKWWGDPDMPEHMQYPVVNVTEESGETYGYPLTFICQINCEDIAPFDTEGRLPHEGMLYFFAAIDEWLGYGSATGCGPGEWPKGEFVVKYAKSINFETFQSCMLIDDDGEPLTDRELEIVFSACEDDADGFKLLGKPSRKDTLRKYPDMISLLQLGSDGITGLQFHGDTAVNLLIRDSDLKFGNWKRTKAYMSVDMTELPE